MFRFASPEYLYLLLPILALVGLFIFNEKRQKQKLRLFGNIELLRDLMPNVSIYRPRVKFSLILVAMAFLVFALARPQFGSKLQTVKKQGIEVMIALDISNSMLAQDVSPNRLENAKMLLAKMIDNMHDDRVGLIVFAGDAFVQIPITADYVSAKMYLSTISPNLIYRQGTAIGAAIDMAVSAFGTAEIGRSRTVIVITDGDNHEDDAVAAAKSALEKGVSVNVVGVGRAEGVPIPIPGTNSFRKDEAGNVVVAKLNEAMCQEIAQAGKGIYVRADNSNSAWKALEQEISRMSKSELETKVYSDYDEKFYIFAWLALIILLVEYFILNRKNKKLTKINLFDKEIFKGEKE